MSAAAARRRKQLAARTDDQDSIAKKLTDLLQLDDLDEPTAYEALQLAQSQVRRKIKALQFADATDLCYSVSLTLLNKKRVSVASQLLTLLVEVLRETHTEESDVWLERIEGLAAAHTEATQSFAVGLETTRLHRLQRDWLIACLNWSADLGTVKYGSNRLQKLLAEQCWRLSFLEETTEDVTDLKCDAVQHMILAEDPLRIVQWLKTLPGPTEEDTLAQHSGPMALREALLVRPILLACAVENLRDANHLLKEYLKQIETRDPKELAESYTNKEDGKAPSAIIFCSMLLRICEKDTRTGPLFSWLIRSFKRELDRLYRPQAIVSYTTKIGKIYFNIQPPPSMMSMMENMMGMMGGGGGGGMNPAMMQAAMAQMQNI